MRLHNLSRESTKTEHVLNSDNRVKQRDGAKLRPLSVVGTDHTRMYPEVDNGESP